MKTHNIYNHARAAILKRVDIFPLFYVSVLSFSVSVLKPSI